MTFIYQEQNASLQSKFHFQIKNIDIFQQRRPIQSSKCLHIVNQSSNFPPTIYERINDNNYNNKKLYFTFLQLKNTEHLNSWYLYNLKNTT